MKLLICWERVKQSNFTVTLPSVKYGLISAMFVVFTLSFTDFGAPKIVGGQYNVLATDVYKQVIGQQNMPMGATVGMILLIPLYLHLQSIVLRKESRRISYLQKQCHIE